MEDMCRLLRASIVSFEKGGISIAIFAGPSLNIALPALFGSKKRQADQIVDREFFFGRER